MRAKQEQVKAQAAKAKLTAVQDDVPSGMTETDAKVAAVIRKRAEAEAERKIKSGNLTSGPGIKVSPFQSVTKQYNHLISFPISLSLSVSV